MKRFFITSINPTLIDSIKKSLMEAFEACDISSANNCDEALKLINSNYDGYIFDKENCNYFDVLINKVLDRDVPCVSITDLSSEKINNIGIFEKDRKIISIDKNTFLFADHCPEIDLCKILCFIFDPPIFYFSYGNKNQNSEMDISRNMLLEIEKCIVSAFPNIITKKDYTDFVKGGLHSNYKKELTLAPYNVLILSEEYFKSFFCMEELHLILESTNYNLNNFNKKTFIIFSNGIESHFEPTRRTREHGDFMDKLRSYWLNELDKSYKEYSKPPHNEVYKQSVEIKMNIITHVLGFISNQLHEIMRGESITLKSIENHGYSDLIREVDLKLEANNLHTFYKHLSKAKKGIHFSTIANTHKKYKEIL